MFFHAKQTSHVIINLNDGEQEKVEKVLRKQYTRAKSMNFTDERKRRLSCNLLQCEEEKTTRRLKRFFLIVLIGHVRDLSCRSSQRLRYYLEKPATNCWYRMTQQRWIRTDIYRWFIVSTDSRDRTEKTDFDIPEQERSD